MKVKNDDLGRACEEYVEYSNGSGLLFRRKSTSARHKIMRRHQRQTRLSTLASVEVEWTISGDDRIRGTNFTCDHYNNNSTKSCALCCLSQSVNHEARDCASSFTVDVIHRTSGTCDYCFDRSAMYR